MKTAPKTGSKLSQLHKLSLGATLALAACASFAGATVNITSFIVSTDGVPFVEPKFAWASDPTSDLTLAALDAGGLYGAGNNSYSDDSWDASSNYSASTLFTSATGNVITFTDAMTQLATGGFNLLALATRASPGPGATLANSATATGLQTGGFTLLGGDGLGVAGTITFDIYYSLDVSTPAGGGLVDDAEALVNFYAADNQGNNSFADALRSSALTGGAGSIDGHFSVSFNLAAGEVAYYALGGTAFASASPVPEPNALFLGSLGLAVVGAAMRKAKKTAR